MYQKSHMTGLAPTQPMDRNTSTRPVSHLQTVRRDDLACVTSMLGGEFLPIAMVPLLREDRALNSTVTLNFQMSETSDMLLNAVRATASAWLVPKMAFERYSGYDSINRSYNGQPEIDDLIIPWFQPWDPAGKAIIEKMGLHFPDGSMANSDYVEAYNAVWNHIAKNMSKDIELRDSFDGTLAPGFWEHSQMKHVKSTFDDAMMEGQIGVEFEQTDLPVRGLGVTSPMTSLPTNIGDHLDTAGDGADRPYFGSRIRGTTPGDGENMFAVEFNSTTGLPAVFAELKSEGLQISLANIDLARETAAWARLRTRYQGLDEDWMMDQLLSGIAMPEEAMKQPILLDKKSVPFGMMQRYATDGASLDQSATNGATSMQLRVRTPAVNTGGIIVICAQSAPEMVYERQRDYYFMADSVDKLPNRTADELDPQPVVEVFNVEVDEIHTLPGEVFGYAPLNHEWMRNKPKVGGKYYRSDPTGPWDEDRNRIWDTTTVDPQLGEDFYLTSNIRHDVFMDQTDDHFEVWASGSISIQGLTHFGPMLRESTDDYEKVQAQVDMTRLSPASETPAIVQDDS